MNEEKRTENIRQINEVLAGFEVAMLTTLQARDGSLHSRPMMYQNQPFDGSLWFFSKFSSAKVDEIRGGSQVNLSFASAEKQRYVSISGSAYVIRERMRMEALWDEKYRTWFPNGLDEPDLVLLRVDVVEAEVWDAKRKASGLSIRLA